MMTYQEAARVALLSQDSDNVFGLALQLPTVMQAIWLEAKRIGEDGNWVNENPIITLILTRMAKLNGLGDVSIPLESKAYMRVARLARGEE